MDSESDEVNFESWEEEEFLTSDKSSKPLEANILNAIKKAILSWFLFTWRGKRLLVVGPTRAGKTHFVIYLIKNILRKEAPFKRIKRTPTLIKHKKVSCECGNITLRAKKVYDTAGTNLLLNLHVKQIKKRKPHCLLILVDASSPREGRAVPLAEDEEASSLTWLNKFCPLLGKAMATPPGLLGGLRRPRFIKKLKSIIVIMNKWDKIPEELKQSFQESVEKIVDNTLKVFREIRGDGCILYEPCVSAQSRKFPAREARAMLENIKQEIALSLEMKDS